MRQISEKLNNMMLAHLDGVYKFSARLNCDELVTELINTIMKWESVKLGDDRTFRDLYEKLANEYALENSALYTAIAPLLGLKPFYGTCNKQQVIWAHSQEEANSLPAGANIYQFVKKIIQA